MNHLWATMDSEFDEAPSEEASSAEIVTLFSVMNGDKDDEGKSE